MNNTNPTLRCPLPPVGADPDSLRQFAAGTTPKVRVLPLPAQTGGNTTEKSGGTSSSSGSSGGSSVTPSAIRPATVSIAISTLLGTTAVNVPMAQSFQLLSISANKGCCVRLYGNSTFRQQDVGRPVDAPPPAEVTQGMMIDVVLDTAPFMWLAQNIIGANQDASQATTVYMSVFNIDPTPVSGLIITLVYVPLET